MTRHLWTIPLTLSLAAVGLVTFTSTHAFAEGVAGVSPQSNYLDAAKAIFNAFSGGHYAYAAVLLVIAAMAVLKQYSGTGKFGRFIHSDVGGTLWTLITSMALALASALVAPGAVLTFGLAKTAFAIGVTAAGGYTVLKRILIVPLIKPLHAWLAGTRFQKPFDIVLWFFDRKDFPSDAADPVTPPPAPPASSAEPSILKDAPSPQEKP